ncbi:unnamed protein product (mitochondrion) [Plasmodiophora brassicae]|uniref:Alanine--tRNA ligase n=1 Tax=Plasmodiophora brassicae TaxID=37360 RepID=A0A3P3Y9R0_PLABS|nr:unnamed protein product [Plasmodiophora brassicae]
MSTWTCDRVRQTFIEFFQGKDHTFYPSSRVIPYDDPTLLFINSGMCQFKPIFLGSVDPSTPLSKLSRACNSQKCIRAGGKHNDLDDVGKDTYHHTFFEMLGNWSFGDYFKAEAITWAMELLHDVYGLSKDRLYATYFEGNEELGLEPDLESRDLWCKFLDPSHVLPGNMKDNFWEMGDQGPCGPCSELHYDRIGGRNAADLVNMDDPDVIEIWNIVFMQYNREPDRSLVPLPSKHIDTGMGFERLVSILQNVRSNYDTDVFQPYFQEIQRLTGVRPYKGQVGKHDTDGIDMAYRVIADHIRNLSVAIADGSEPGPTGRQYVLRRILRRAVRYAHSFLGAKDGFFSQLVPVVCQTLGGAFPELIREADRIKAVLAEEETLFRRTLQKGEREFKKCIQNITDKVVPGEVAFRLYDTYGFPLDLTVLMAEEQGMTVDTAHYEKAMEKARDLSRCNARSGKVELRMEAEHIAHMEKVIGVLPTDDAHKYVSDADLSSTVQAIFFNRAFVPQTTEGEEAVHGVVLKASSFYAESGGQIFDTGILHSADKSTIFQVSDCQSWAGIVVHIGTIVKGSIRTGDTLHLSVDYSRRSRIVPNHTATHILNYALRTVLGDHIDQKGSLVDDAKLRFDFSHPSAVKVDDLKRIEQICNQQIEASLRVFTKVVPLALAKKICSLRAVFGETYPDPVRVVSIGESIDAMVADPENREWFKYSVEFCGGNHLSNTATAQHLSIISEVGIAKGIRRIVAVTAESSHESVARAADLLGELRRVANGEKAKIGERVTRIRTKFEDMSSSLPAIAKYEIEQFINETLKSYMKFKKEQIKELENGAIAALEKSAERSLPFIVHRIDVDAKSLKNIIGKAKIGGTPAFLISGDDGKGKCAVVAQGSSTIDPTAWISAALQPLGGKAFPSAKPGQVVQGAAPGGDVNGAIHAAEQFARSISG